MGKKYLSTNGIVVVIANTNRQIKYIAASNHAALIAHATQRLIRTRSCNSLTSGCKPKNIINGNKSQNLDALKSRDKTHVPK